MLLGLIQQQVAGPTATSQFTVSDNLVNGLDLHANGQQVLSSFENAAGGTTVNLGVGTGETATITDNIYGGQTINFSNPTMADIVSRPGLFDSQTFYQDGSAIATLEPTMIGDGLTLASDAGTLVGSVGLFDTVSLKLKAFTTPTYMSDISSISSAATSVDAVSVADSFAVVEGLDGLDVLDFL